MFRELKRNLIPFAVTAIILAAVVSGSGVGATDSAQVPLSESAAAEYPREINVRQAREKLSGGAFFLDVRESGEWDVMRVPGAVLIPLGQLPNRLNQIPRDKEIVIVCASGSRSRTALDIVRKAGFEKSSSMSGGVLLWRRVGYPLETEK